ncbi:MAG: hypothetical protein JKX92_12300 [Porticoccaceae bacterium]|nr:hypothetical protein [Porticoccaceae bacterium]
MTTTNEDYFAEFWRAFPKGRKTSKADARRKFVAIVSGKHRDLKASAEDLIGGAARYARAMGDEHPYVKMPSTWLNGGCWEDEDMAPPAALPVLRHPGALAPTGGVSTKNRSLQEDLTDRSWTV